MNSTIAKHDDYELVAIHHTDWSGPATLRLIDLPDADDPRAANAGEKVAEIEVPAQLLLRFCASVVTSQIYSTFTDVQDLVAMKFNERVNADVLEADDEQ